MQEKHLNSSLCVGWWWCGGGDAQGNACGARSDGVFDNAEALAACVALAAARKPSPGVVVLGRGIYRISKTLVLPPGVSLVGAGLHLTSLVPTSTGFALEPERAAIGAGTPLLRTTGGQNREREKKGKQGRKSPMKSGVVLPRQTQDRKT